MHFSTVAHFNYDKGKIFPVQACHPPPKKTEEHDEEVIVSKASATTAQLMWQSRQIYLDG